MSIPSLMVRMFVPTGKSWGEGSSMMIEPLPTTCATNHRLITMYFPTTNRRASRTNTRLLPLNSGISSVETMIVLAEPTPESDKRPGGGFTCEETVE